VRAGEDVYVRSRRGTKLGSRRPGEPRGSRLRRGVEEDVAFVDADDQASDAVDPAFRAKCRRYSDSCVTPMANSPARDTTLTLVPRATGGRS
jgi:hypothetical protein